MTTRVVDDAAAVARAAADVVAEEIAVQTHLTMALPTGHTPLPLYDELALRHQRRRIDLSRARGFNLDELVLPRGDERTFRAYMERHAWERIGMPRERCDIPDGAAPDVESECARYERAITQAHGIGLAIVGLGIDGHVAYNMPGPIVLPAHVVQLPDALAAALGVPAEERPLRALTMGIGTIRAARRIVAIATGPTKATAVWMLVHGREDPQWPCTFLRSHAHIEAIVDKAAAARL